MTTVVVNVKRDNYDQYIGRVKHSNQHFGNPFSHLNDAQGTVLVDTRLQAIANFEKWLDGAKEFEHVEPERRKWILSNLHRLKNRRLGCFCKPQPCHGDVYVKRLDYGNT